MNSTEDKIVNLIEKYFDEHKNISESRLSEITGYDRSSIKKLRKKEYDKSRMDVLALTNFITYISGNKQQSIELIKNDDIFGRHLKNNYSFLDKLANYETKDSSIAHFIFANNLRMKVYILSSNRNGTTEEEIKEVLGIEGMFALNELLENEIIKKTENKIHTFDDETKATFVIEKNETKKIAKGLASDFKADYYDDNLNKAFFFTQAWSEKFYKEVQEKANEFHTWLCENANKDENIGNFPGFTCFFLDSFIKDTKKRKEKK